MKIYIDCEWTKFDGELISMALVPHDSTGLFKPYFYEALPWAPHLCDPWVVDNVLPVIDKEPVEKWAFDSLLSQFFNQFSYNEPIHIIADWPEDIAWFCRALITGPGMRMNTPPLLMQIVRVNSKSENPHNALADAMGIRDYFLNT